MDSGGGPDAGLLQMRNVRRDSETVKADTRPSIDERSVVRMSFDQKSKPPLFLPPDAPGALPDGESPTQAAGALHGRMLQVSRLATIGEMAAGVAHELNQPLTAIAN